MLGTRIVLDEEKIIKEQGIEGIKNFTIAFKLSEYKKLKDYCEDNHLSMGRFIKKLIEKEGVI